MSLFLDYHNVTGTSGGSGTLDYAFLQNITQTNLNSAPIQPRNILFNVATFISTIPGVTVNINGFATVPVGTYLLSHTLTTIVSGVGNQRTNLAVNFFVNGTLINNGQSASYYMRNVNGHGTSSGHGETMMELLVPSTIQLVGTREANVGTIVTPGGLSNLAIYKVL